MVVFAKELLFSQTVEFGSIKGVFMLGLFHTVRIELKTNLNWIILLYNKTKVCSKYSLLQVHLYLSMWMQSISYLRHCIIKKKMK